jgi:hypothetical protein
MHSECVFVALVIQHATRVRHIDICDCLALPHFFTLSHKRQEFRGGKTVNMNYVLIFCTNFVCNVSHTKKYSARYDHKCT